LSIMPASPPRFSSAGVCLWLVPCSSCARPRWLSWTLARPLAALSKGGVQGEEGALSRAPAERVEQSGMRDREKPKGFLPRRDSREKAKREPMMAPASG